MTNDEKKNDEGKMTTGDNLKSLENPSSPTSLETPSLPLNNELVQLPKENSKAKTEIAGEDDLIDVTDRKDVESFINIWNIDNGDDSIEDSGINTILSMSQKSTVNTEGKEVLQEKSKKPKVVKIEILRNGMQVRGHSFVSITSTPKRIDENIIEVSNV